MKKYLRVLLCVCFAVVLPFSCFGCKSNEGKGSSGNNQTPNNSGQSQAYALDENEVKRLMIVSADYSEQMIEKMNDKSEFLQQNNYDSLLGGNTASLINYSYYPKSIVETLVPSLQNKAVPGNFTLARVYYYLSGGLEQRYIVVNAIENKEVLIKIVSYDGTDFLYLNYTLYVDKGEIYAMNIAKYTAPSSGASLNFANCYFDFKNASIRASFGGVLSLTYSNAESLFKNYFTKDKFANIPTSTNGWTYSYYEKINFTSLQYESSTQKGSEKVIGDFDNFKFLDAYDRYYEYQELYPDNAEKDQNCDMGSDIFATINANSNFYRYDNDEFKFEKNN